VNAAGILSPSKTSHFGFNTMPSAHFERRAFTLIELLVVIAVIAILAGIAGVTLRGGDRGAALQSGQSALSSLVASARAQASIRLNNATIVVWGEYDASKPEVASTYLHRAAVMTYEDTKPVPNGVPDAWVIRGDVLDLPRGVYFVPPDLGGIPSAKYAVAGDWPANYDRTEAQGGAAKLDMVVKRWNADAKTYEDDPSVSDTLDGYLTITFDSQGQLVDGRTLVISLADSDPDGLLFNDSDSQRGLVLSAYGVPTVINEKAGLKNN
jgi:prepilin-type N-terminal cleavage/methylation domain-containing protein